MSPKQNIQSIPSKLAVGDKEFDQLVQRNGHVWAGRDKKGIWPDAPMDLDKLPFLKNAVLPRVERLSFTPLRILDAGCGNAARSVSIARYLSEHGKRVELTLADYQEDAIAAAKKMVVDHGKLDGVEYKFHQGRIEETVGQMGVFDAVLFFNVLHFLTKEQIAAALGGACQALAEGGQVVTDVCTPYNRSSIGTSDPERLSEVKTQIRNARAELLRRQGDPKYDTMTYFTPKALEKCLREAGFEVLEMESYRNNTYPNGQSSDKYAENVIAIAQK